MFVVCLQRMLQILLVVMGLRADKWALLIPAYHFWSHCSFHSVVLCLVLYFLLQERKWCRYIIDCRPWTRTLLPMGLLHLSRSQPVLWPFDPRLVSCRGVVHANDEFDRRYAERADHHTPVTRNGAGKRCLGFHCNSILHGQPYPRRC